MKEHIIIPEFLCNKKKEAIAIEKETEVEKEITIDERYKHAISKLGMQVVSVNNSGLVLKSIEGIIITEKLSTADCRAIADAFNSIGDTIKFG